MSNTAPGAPKLGPTIPTAINVTFPKPIIDRILLDVAQAHCSLGVLVELLRSNGQPDPQGLAHFLAYIETALEKSDEVISSYLHDGAHPG
jgi:hypothetical protein